MQTEGSIADSQVMCMTFKTILSTSLKPVLERQSEIITVSRKRDSEFCVESIYQGDKRIVETATSKTKAFKCKIFCDENRRLTA